MIVPKALREYHECPKEHKNTGSDEDAADDIVVTNQVRLEQQIHPVVRALITGDEWKRPLLGVSGVDPDI